VQTIKPRTNDFSRTFTLCVDGKATLAFSASTMREAQELCKEAWLRSDLCALTSEQQALCTPGSKLTVRHAAPEEESVYQQSADPASEDLSLVYLVALDGKTAGRST
jgi:hypothetical protein